MSEALKRWNGSEWVTVANVCRVNENIPLEDEATYPTVVSAGYKNIISGVAQITSTPGNLLVAFYISRLDTLPIANLNGWKNWGGFAPLRRTSTTTQRIWIATKVSTGNDPFTFVSGEPAPYALLIVVELSGANLQEPLNIGVAPAVTPCNQDILLSKSKNKLILWAGHAMYFSYEYGSPIRVISQWQGFVGGTLINGPLNTPTPYTLCVGIDQTKMTDWGVSTQPGLYSLRYIYSSGEQVVSILPVAINAA